MIRNDNFIIAATGSNIDDELAVLEYLNIGVKVIEAACDGKLSAISNTAFYGKAVICLHEAFIQGHIITTNEHNILRNAKLKSPDV